MMAIIVTYLPMMVHRPSQTQPLQPRLREHGPDVPSGVKGSLGKH
jgi:hypothetical protein